MKPIKVDEKVKKLAEKIFNRRMVWTNNKTFE